MKHAHAALLLASLPLLPACLENEEEIEVRADGSVRVTLRAGGQPSDLDDGYALPLDAAWASASADTALWLARVGPDTGSAATRAALARSSWPLDAGEDEPRAGLAVTRDFARLEDVPRHFAPDSEPYRSAYLERTGSLTIRADGARTVYVFERVFHGRDHARFATLERAFESLPEELRQRFADEQAISAVDWELTAGAVRAAFRENARLFARDALLGVFTRGDASLDPRAVEGIVARAGDAVAEVVTVPRLAAIAGHSADERAGEARPAAEAPNPLESLEQEARSVLRASVEQSLAAARVSGPTRNAVLFALEWGFTAHDHTVDLGDETFEVSVTLPGTLVGGNFGSAAGATARWEFEGEELRDRDLVLRAVSVLD